MSDRSVESEGTLIESEEPAWIYKVDVCPPVMNPNCFLPAPLVALVPVACLASLYVAFPGSTIPQQHVPQKWSRLQVSSATGNSKPKP